MYQTIVYPTDGSDGAQFALDHAREHARRYDADLHALFVADTGYVKTGMVAGEHDIDTSGMVEEGHETTSSGMVSEEHDPLRPIEEEGQEIVEDVAASVDDVPVTTAVRRGDPYETILEYADDVGADLLVMGTHGRTGIDRYLLGSVTEKVVRTADAPVLTVRMHAE